MLNSSSMSRTVLLGTFSGFQMLPSVFRFPCQRFLFGHFAFDFPSVRRLHLLVGPQVFFEDLRPVPEYVHALFHELDARGNVAAKELHLITKDASGEGGIFYGSVRQLFDDSLGRN